MRAGFRSTDSGEIRCWILLSDVNKYINKHFTPESESIVYEKKITEINKPKAKATFNAVAPGDDKRERHVCVCVLRCMRRTYTYWLHSSDPMSPSWLGEKVSRIYIGAKEKVGKRTSCIVRWNWTEFKSLYLLLPLIGSLTWQMKDPMGNMILSKVPFWGSFKKKKSEENYSYYYFFFYHKDYCYCQFPSCLPLFREWHGRVCIQKGVLTFWKKKIQRQTV